MKKLFFIMFLIFSNAVLAKTIGMTWDGASSSPSSCTYGGTFTPPTPDAVSGYVFVGWKVKEVHPAETCGIENLTSSTKADGYTKSGYTWSVNFGYGTSQRVIQGEAKCSNLNRSSGCSSGNSVAIGDPGTTTGNRCWCRITGYKPAGGQMCTVSPASGWVYRIAMSSADACATSSGNCAAMCGQIFTNTDSSAVNCRKILYSAVTQ
jgi:hypothetical protein